MATSDPQSGVSPKARRRSWPLALPCAGLNFLVAGLAAAGAQLGGWFAEADGSAVGLAAGLFVGLVGHALGVEAVLQWRK